MRRLNLNCILIVVLSVSAADAQDPIAQLPTGNAQNLGLSDYGTQPFTNGFRSWEQFALSEDTVVSGVTWWSASGSMNTATGLIEPSDTDASQWCIQFRDVETNGATFFHSEDLDFTSVVQGDRPFQDNGVVRSYTNRAIFSNAIKLEANTPYWITLLAKSERYDPFNAWWSSNQGDRRLVRSIVFSNRRIWKLQYEFQ